MCIEMPDELFDRLEKIDERIAARHYAICCLHLGVKRISTYELETGAYIE